MNDNCTETIVIDYSNNTGGGCYIPGSQLIYPEASEVDGNMVITISMDFYGGQKLQRLYNGKYINLELSDIVPAMFPFVLDATYIDSEAELGQDYNYRVLYNVSSIYDTYSPFNKNFTALLNSSS